MAAEERSDGFSGYNKIAGFCLCNRAGCTQPPSYKISHIHANEQFTLKQSFSFYRWGDHSPYSLGSIFPLWCWARDIIIL